MTATLPCRLTGFGIALPEQRETNDDLAARLDTSDEWIRSRTGIAARHVASVETTTDLAIAAGAEALADAGLDPSDVGLVVVATATPDSPCPSVASRVAAAHGSTAPAFDVNAACAGFVHALVIAASFPATGPDPTSPRHALVIGVDRFRSLTDPDDRSTAVLFGDGAGAVVVSTPPVGTAADPRTDDEGPGILGVDLCSDPDGLDSLQVPIGGRWLEMDGQDVYRRAVRGLVASAGRALARAGTDPAEIDRFIPHQANVRIIEAITQRLGIPDDRVEVDLVQRANTSAASIPLALHDAVRAGRITSGDRLLLGGMGAGMGIGSLVLRWQR